MSVINTTYDANEVNQYSSIRKNEESAFVPTFDAAGNQTLVLTTTGTWSVSYNAENRPVIFQKTTDSVTTRITCTYDYMGRRATKKVEEITTDAEGNETTTVISNQRFIYRGYLQIACCDLTRSGHPCLWLITWNPTQPVATRPLAIQKDGTWYTYGWDLTKNICEIFRQNGYIRSTYAYTPFGSVTASGDVSQPIQWSSEYFDNELALVYYNYRHYNPTDGRWINRDPIAEQGGWNLYAFVGNNILECDYLGAQTEAWKINCIGHAMDLGRAADPEKNSLEQWLISHGWACQEFNGHCNCNCNNEKAMVVFVYFTNLYNEQIPVEEYYKKQNEILDKGLFYFRDRHPGVIVNVWRVPWEHLRNKTLYTRDVSVIDYHAIRRNCEEKEGSSKAWDYIPRLYKVNEPVPNPIPITNPNLYFTDKRQIISSRCCIKKSH